MSKVDAKNYQGLKPDLVIIDEFQEVLEKGQKEWEAVLEKTEPVQPYKYICVSDLSHPGGEAKWVQIPAKEEPETGNHGCTLTPMESKVYLSDELIVEINKLIDLRIKQTK